MTKCYFLRQNDLDNSETIDIFLELLHCSFSGLVFDVLKTIEDFNLCLQLKCFH